ncbi:MAG: hypothetical protein BRC22_02280 [Parcubacteria group bacterium QH_9_35_7]|nr:MAG: hypothetical protein BRC22_02280 [Parcubacteria group bacterium QH_9_35_7]
MRKYNTQNSKKAKRKKWKRMFLSKTFRIVLICLTLFFFSVYIVKKSSMATRGYKISELKQRIDKLENENERIQEIEKLKNRYTTINHLLPLSSFFVIKVRFSHS